MKEIMAIPVSIPAYSISLAKKRETHFQSLTVTPSWKRQILFGALFSILVFFNCILLPVTGAIHYYATFPGPYIWLAVMLMGVHLGQWLLLCAWMSFGTFRTPWRQLICTLLSFAGAGALTYWISGQSEARISLALALALLTTSTFWFIYAGLSVVRALASITLEFQQLRAVAYKSPRRFSISSVLAFTFVLAIPCALLQWANYIHSDMLTGSLTVTVAAVVFLVAMLPLALAMLMPKRWITWTSVALIPFGLVLSLVYLARGLVGLEAVVVLLGAGLAVVVNTGILRWLGARWLPTTAASDDGAAPSAFAGQA